MAIVHAQPICLLQKNALIQWALTVMTLMIKTARSTTFLSL